MDQIITIQPNADSKIRLNKTIKNIIILGFLLLNFFALTAQTNSLVGKVYDDANEPVVYGKILLNSAKESKITVSKTLVE